MLNTSTPMGFWLASPMYFQLCVITDGRRDSIPDQPPALATDMMASGANPSTIRKNWRTSL